MADVQRIHNHLTSLYQFTYTISELFIGITGALRILESPVTFAAILWKVSSKQRRVTGRTWLWGFRHHLIARYVKDTDLNKYISVGGREISS
jgi:hypothetical protein